MSITDVLEAMEATTISQAISSGVPWRHLFPAIETVHVLSLTIVVGTIVMVDMRLLGLASRDSAVSRLAREVLPWTWIAFVMAAVSGTLLFMSKAETYYGNLQFRLKFLFMFFAFVNMLVFHFGVYRRIHTWDHKWPPPAAARVAGALSIGLWITVIVFGRWIGFTT